MNYTDWGLIDYKEAFEKQRLLNLEVQSDPSKQTIVFCQHSAVVTYGRTTKPEDYKSWEGYKIEVDRGGKATYHGPNQVIIYPIIDLEKPRFKNLKPTNIKAYLNFLETLIIDVLADFNIKAEQKCNVENTETGESLLGTGVWVGDKKIASIGVSIKKWRSMHGLALNVNTLGDKVQNLRPCGFQPEQMTSMQDCLGSVVDVSAVFKAFQEKLNKLSIL